jgi:hypothetical protein
MIVNLDTEVGRGSIMHVPHALVKQRGTSSSYCGRVLTKKIEVCFPCQTIGKNMWTNEKIVQQSAPHTERKALLMCLDRHCMKTLLFPRVHVVTIKNPIFCECGLIGNQHISSEMGIDGSLVDVPPTKGGKKWIVFCSQCLQFLQMKGVELFL